MGSDIKKPVGDKCRQIRPGVFKIAHEDKDPFAITDEDKDPFAITDEDKDPFAIAHEDKDPFAITDEDKDKPIVTKYVKILNERMLHGGFQYKEGLNVDKIPFNPTGSCQPGGLYFTDIDNYERFLDYGILIADVDVPPGIEIYADPGVYGGRPYKWKASQLFISNIRPISSLPQWTDLKYCLSMISQYPDALKFINPDNFTRKTYEDICLAAVTKDGTTIRHIKPDRQVNNVCLAAIRQNSSAFQCISEDKRSYRIFMDASRDSSYKSHDSGSD